MTDSRALAGMLGLDENLGEEEIRERVEAFRGLLEDEDALWIDGDKVTWDHLTFREQRLVRQMAYLPEPEGLGYDKDADAFDELPLMDVYPLMVLVVRRRSNPEYPLADALEVKRADLRRPEAKQNGGRRRPTKKTG